MYVEGESLKLLVGQLTVCLFTECICGSVSVCMRVFCRRLFWREGRRLAPRPVSLRPVLLLRVVPCPHFFALCCGVCIVRIPWLFCGHDCRCVWSKESLYGVRGVVWILLSASTLCICQNNAWREQRKCQFRRWGYISASLLVLFY